MEKIVIVGAGGHAKVVADIVMQNEEYDLVGLIDQQNTEGFWGIPVIGSDGNLPQIFSGGIKTAFVALGANHLRRKITEQVKDIGFCLANVISKAATISTHCIMGEGVLVMPGAVVNAEVVIGNGCIINTNASIDHEGVLGEYVHIAPGSSIAGSVTIGNNCFLGTGCRVINNVSIGKNVIVGAGAVVINNIESDCTVVGVPARKTK